MLSVSCCCFGDKCRNLILVFDEIFISTLISFLKSLFRKRIIQECSFNLAWFTLTNPSTSLRIHVPIGLCFLFPVVVFRDKCRNLILIFDEIFISTLISFLKLLFRRRIF